MQHPVLAPDTPHSITRCPSGPGFTLVSAALLLLALLGGCATDGGSREDVTDVTDIADGDVAADAEGTPELVETRDAVPRAEPRSRSGNPPSYVVFGKRYYTKASSQGHVERGLASWYGKKFHGRRTSSGETYNMYSMTAAHKTLPLPTYVRVINLDNKRSIVVRVNDRGPFHDGRIIDLSYAAAKKLGVLKHGTARVEVRAIDARSNSGEDVLVAGDSPEHERNDTRVTTAQSAPDTATDRPVYLQVGAFGDPVNAERLRERLTDRVNNPILVENDDHDGLALYKVRIGPLASHGEAERLSTELASLGVGKVQLIQN